MIINKFTITNTAYDCQIFFSHIKWDPIRDPASVVPSLIPWQGPFHVSLNAEESTVLLFRPLFEKLYKKLFGRNKVTEIINNYNYYYNCYNDH